MQAGVLRLRLNPAPLAGRKTTGGRAQKQGGIQWYAAILGDSAAAKDLGRVLRAANPRYLIQPCLLPKEPRPPPKDLEQDGRSTSKKKSYPARIRTWN